MPLVRRIKKVEKKQISKEFKVPKTKTELYHELHTATGKPHKQIAILTGFLRQEICLPNGSDPERLFGQVTIQQFVKLSRKSKMLIKPSSIY